MAAAAAETGFSIDGHFLQLTGTCEECRARRRADPSGVGKVRS
jgi:Fe2+ or Zn2+ uptake regulation protein